LRGAIGTKGEKMVGGPHQSGGRRFTPVTREVRILMVAAFGRLDKNKLLSGTLNSRPVNILLMVRNIDAGNGKARPTWIIETDGAGFVQANTHEG
jgi:hypothetical protein